MINQSYGLHPGKFASSIELVLCGIGLYANNDDVKEMYVERLAIIILHPLDNYEHFR